jgi:hypothetical protein
MSAGHSGDPGLARGVSDCARGEAYPRHRSDVDDATAVVAEMLQCIAARDNRAPRSVSSILRSCSVVCSRPFDLADWMPGSCSIRRKRGSHAWISSCVAAAHARNRTAVRVHPPESGRPRGRAQLVAAGDTSSVAQGYRLRLRSANPRERVTGDGQRRTSLASACVSIASASCCDRNRS